MRKIFRDPSAAFVNFACTFLAIFIACGIVWDLCGAFGYDPRKPTIVTASVILGLIVLDLGYGLYCRNKRYSGYDSRKVRREEKRAERAQKKAQKRVPETC